jgi:hypothetical protein
MLSIHK